MTAANQGAPPEASLPGAQSAARGVIWLAAAKGYFMVAGAAMQLLLPTLLAPASFGAFVVLSSLVSPLNNVLVTGTVQTLSRVAAKGEAVRTAIRRGWRMHAWVGWPAVALYAATGTAVLHWYLHDAGKVVPLLATGAIALLYAHYAVYVGVANGRRRFALQAKFDMAAATLRSGMVLAAAALGAGLWGVLGAWIAAAAVMLALAAVVHRGMHDDQRGTAMANDEDGRSLAATFAAFALLLLSLNGLLWLETWVVKRYAGAWHLAHTAERAQLDALGPWARAWLGGPWRAEQLADIEVAFYAAPQNVARLIYQAVIAVTFVIFPVMTQATMHGDRPRARTYVGRTVHGSFLFVVAAVVAMAVSPQALLDVVYRADFARVGGPLLLKLALGSGALAMFAVLATIANATGLERQTWRVAVGVLVMTLGLASWWGAQAVSVESLRQGVAMASVAGLGLGCLGVGWMVTRTLGPCIALWPLARMVGAGLLAVLLARQVAGSSLGQTVAAIALAEAALVGMLLTTGDLPVPKRWRRRRAV